MIDYYSDTREDSIDPEEQLLYNLIMDYRAQNGLSTIPISESLTLVASRHALDTVYNIGTFVVDRNAAHGWSDAAYFGDDPSTYTSMWEAPQRLGTVYPGNGFEISIGFSEGIETNEITAHGALSGWQSSSGHNNVILNLGPWAAFDWNAIGISIHKGVGHVWFGAEADPAGDPPNPPMDPTEPTPVVDWTMQKNNIELTAATYQFFTDRIPLSQGFEYLISSNQNNNDLNDPYYEQFNQENRYINFANNLGAIGEGKQAFAQEYGFLSFEQTVRSAYAKITGDNSESSIQFFLNAQNYYEAVAQERVASSEVTLDLATKVVAIGSILNEAIKSDAGTYATAVDTFADEVQVTGTSSSFGMDLFASM